MSAVRPALLVLALAGAARFRARPPGVGRAARAHRRTPGGPRRRQEPARWPSDTLASPPPNPISPAPPGLRAPGGLLAGADPTHMRGRPMPPRLRHPRSAVAPVTARHEQARRQGHAAPRSRDADARRRGSVAPTSSGPGAGAPAPPDRRWSAPPDPRSRGGGHRQSRRRYCGPGDPSPRVGQNPAPPAARTRSLHRRECAPMPW